MTTMRRVTWVGVDDTSRVDQAVIEIGATSMHGIGSARSRGFSSSWELDVADGWITRTLRVTTRGVGWARSVELSRSDTGEWASAATATGAVDLPAPGLVDPSSVHGALDCDLGFCPVTNTMPIRRLELLDRDVDQTHLVMAWVDVPSLRVTRSDQVYASGPAGERTRIHYRSLHGQFTAQLTVDPDGVVIDYPTLARRSPVPFPGP
jgi:uncharacterized protein